MAGLVLADGEQRVAHRVVGGDGALPAGDQRRERLADAAFADRRCDEALEIARARDGRRCIELARRQRLARVGACQSEAQRRMTDLVERSFVGRRDKMSWCPEGHQLERELGEAGHTGVLVRGVVGPRLGKLCTRAVGEPAHVRLRSAGDAPSLASSVGEAVDERTLRDIVDQERAAQSGLPGALTLTW